MPYGWAERDGGGRCAWGPFGEVRWDGVLVGAIATPDGSSSRVVDASGGRITELRARPAQTKARPSSPHKRTCLNPENHTIAALMQGYGDGDSDRLDGDDAYGSDDW